MSGLYKCPFDPLHQISANSFAKHLTKCQRQHPDVKYARCPLNSFHLMKPEELNEHVRTCPSRAQFDAYKYSVSVASSAPVDEIIINTGNPPGGSSFASASASARSLQDDDECWDDSNYVAYNPLEKCKQRKEQHKSFITPCANKFVVPNASISMIKQEFQNDDAQERQAVKEEALSEGTQSPERSSEAEPAVQEQHGEMTSQYSERQPAFGGRTDDRRPYRSSANSYNDFERRNEDYASHRGPSDVPSYSNSTYGDTYMGRYDRNRHTSRRSYEDDRQKYKPYHNPYSRNSKMSKDQEDRYQSSRNFRADRGTRYDQTKFLH